MPNLLQALAAICVGYTSVISTPVELSAESVAQTDMTLRSAPFVAEENTEALLPECSAEISHMEEEQKLTEWEISAATAVTALESAEETSTDVSIATESTQLTQTESTEAEAEAAEPVEDAGLFDSSDTWFKAYMDYRTITDTSSEQYALQRSAWTDGQGLRRIGDDYLVAMGTGWLASGCGERFLVTLETGTQFTVMVGDIKADCDTDSTNRYRLCGGGANVLEFIVDAEGLSAEAREAGTVSVYTELAGNIMEIASLE